MDQHDFVKGCLRFYDEAGMYPERGWEEAHYPSPKGIGSTTVWMTHEDHQIQGLLQSEEYGRMCFFPAHVLEYLKRSIYTQLV